MKKIIKKDIVIYIGILIFSSIILWQFISGHYATDTYAINNLGYEKYSINYWLEDGRIIMALVGFISNSLNIPLDIFAKVLTFMGIMISSFIVFMLYKIILKYKSTDNKLIKLLVLIISYITIYNFMYIENLYFVDSFAMSISVLVYILAAYILCKKEKYSFLKSIILVVIGIFSYQATISIFIVFTILFTVLKNINDNKLNKKTAEILIKDILRMISIVAIAVLLNLIFVNIISSIFNLSQNRIGSIKNIFFFASYIVRNVIIQILIGTCGLYPKWMFLIFFSIIFLVVLLYNKKQKENYKTILILFLSILIILSSFLVNLLSLTSIDAGRMRFVIGALIGIIFIYIYVKSNIFEKNLYTE